MEIPHKFWKEYEEADIIERDKKLDVIVDKVDKIFVIKDKKLRKHTLKMVLQGYFDDLLEFRGLENGE